MPPSENKFKKNLKNKTLDASKKKPRDANKNKFIEFKNIDKAAEAAFYYGFTPSEHPSIEQIDIDNAAKIFEEKAGHHLHNGKSRQLEITLEEKNSLLRNYTDKNLIAEPQPIMLSYKNTPSVAKNKQTPSSNEQFLNLQILGSSRSISEIILIKTALAILCDNKIEDVCIEINSIGDRESTNKFVRELASYYRKNINKMPSHCRQLLKKDPFSLLKCDKEEYCKTLNEEAPKSLSCLTEQSRQHFKEILEGFEVLGINYRINNSLVPDRRHCSQTVFQIVRGTDKKREILAYGTRYDGLAKKLGLKKDISAVGLKISLKNLPDNAPSRSKIKKSDYFFIQLGFEAKLKSLNIIEMLRKAKILICQSLSRDMLGGQIALAEKLRLPHTLIMGKRESLENTVMVRDMNTRSQEIISNENLSEYLKKLS